MLKEVRLGLRSYY